MAVYTLCDKIVCRGREEKFCVIGWFVKVLVALLCTGSGLYKLLRNRGFIRVATVMDVSEALSLQIVSAQSD